MGGVREGESEEGGRGWGVRRRKGRKGWGVGGEEREVQCIDKGGGKKEKWSELARNGAFLLRRGGGIKKIEV